MRRALFMGRQHMANRSLPVHCVVKRKIRGAGIAEHKVRPVLTQAFDYQFTAVHVHDLLSVDSCPGFHFRGFLCDLVPVFVPDINPPVSVPGLILVL